MAVKRKSLARSKVAQAILYEEYHAVIGVDAQGRKMGRPLRTVLLRARARSPDPVAPLRSQELSHDPLVRLPSEWARFGEAPGGSPYRPRARRK